MRDFPNTVAVVDHHSIIPGMAHRTKVCGKMRQPDLVFDVDVTAWLKIGSARQVENGIRYDQHCSFFSVTLYQIFSQLPRHEQDLPFCGFPVYGSNNHCLAALFLVS